MTTSSTSSTHAPATVAVGTPARREAGAGARRRNAPATFAARSSRPSSNWAVVARSRSSARTQGSPSVRRRHRGDQGGLVVAAPALALGVDRDRDHQVRRPRRRAAIAERPPGRAVRASRRSPAYFRSWRAARTGPGERRAPLELEQRGGEIDRHADRRAARQVQASIQRPRARRAERLALTPAAGAPPRKREVEGLGGGRRDRSGQAAKDRHRDMVTGGPSPARIAPAASAQAASRRPPGARGRRPTVPVRSIVPAGSSRTPYAPRTSGTRPVQARSPRWTDRTAWAPPCDGVRSGQEDRVDREAHEHHVDPVRSGEPQPGVRFQ